MVAGATGLVGRHLVEGLIRDPAFREVAVLTRRPLDEAVFQEPGVTQLRVDFEALVTATNREPPPATRDASRHGLEGLAADHLFCTLGTTMRTAGSRAAFRRVDHDYPLALARWGAGAGVRQMGLVSAVGADPGSRVFYSRVKGEVEEAVRDVGLPALAILRPSVIGGSRREFRLGERLAGALLSLVPGRYRTVHAREIAACLIRVAKAEGGGVRVLESEEIRKVAGS